jgi:hypothetical protein
MRKRSERLFGTNDRERNEHESGDNEKHRELIQRNCPEESYDHIPLASDRQAFSIIREGLTRPCIGVPVRLKKKRLVLTGGGIVRRHWENVWKTSLRKSSLCWCMGVRAMTTMMVNNMAAIDIAQSKS